MTKRLFYRTIIAIEVLSEEPIPEGMDFPDIIRETVEGEYSGMALPATQTVMNGKEAADALLNQGSSPGFFGLTDDGEDDDR